MNLSRATRKFASGAIDRDRLRISALANHLSREAARFAGARLGFNLSRAGQLQPDRRERLEPARRRGDGGQHRLAVGAKRIGNELLAQTLAQTNVEVFNNYNVKKVITSCPHCFNSIKNEFPDYGGTYEVVHHTDLIDRLIRDGKIKPEAKPNGNVTYHDSCYLGRYNDVIDAPRNTLAAAAGADHYAEMPRHGYKSFCCGAGGGRMWMEELSGTRINLARVEEAMAEKPDTICVSCPYCLTMLEDGLKDKQAADTILVKVHQVGVACHTGERTCFHRDLATEAPHGV